MLCCSRSTIGRHSAKRQAVAVARPSSCIIVRLWCAPLLQKLSFWGSVRIQTREPVPACMGAPTKLLHPR